MKTWESRARSSRMALAPKPSACRPRMKVAMSEPLMDARERRAKGRAAKVFARFFSRATVGFLGRRDLTEVNGPRPRPGSCPRRRWGRRRCPDSSRFLYRPPRPRSPPGVEAAGLPGVSSAPHQRLPDPLAVRALPLPNVAMRHLRVWMSGTCLTDCCGIVAKGQMKSEPIGGKVGKALFFLVPEAGLEPAQPYDRGILSPLRLPISPLGQDHKTRASGRAWQRGLVCFGGNQSSFVAKSRGGDGAGCAFLRFGAGYLRKGDVIG